MADAFSLPTKTAIDEPLVIGAGLFGVGWGLSGFCPGPAVVSLPLLATGTLVFVPAMLVGMLLARALQTKGRPGPDAQSKPRTARRSKAKGPADAAAGP